MNPRRRFPLPQSALVLLALAAALIYFIASFTQRRTSPAAAPADPATRVLTTLARRGSISRTVSIAGRIRAGTETQLAARMPARIVAVRVREGDHVSRGELLARLDDREARSLLAEAEAGARAAAAALANARRGAGIRSAELDSGVTTATAAVQAARARWQQAQGAAQAAEAEADAKQQRAEAALETAKANLAIAVRGGRPSQLRQAEAAVTQAQAAWQAASRGSRGFPIPSRPWRPHSLPAAGGGHSGGDDPRPTRGRAGSSRAGTGGCAARRAPRRRSGGPAGRGRPDRRARRLPPGSTGPAGGCCRCCTAPAGGSGAPCGACQHIREGNRARRCKGGASSVGADAGPAPPRCRSPVRHPTGQPR